MAGQQLYPEYQHSRATGGRDSPPLQQRRENQRGAAACWFGGGAGAGACRCACCYPRASVHTHVARRQSIVSVLMEAKKNRPSACDLCTWGLRACSERWLRGLRPTGCLPSRVHLHHCYFHYLHNKKYPHPVKTQEEGDRSLALRPHRAAKRGLESSQGQMPRPRPMTSARACAESLPLLPDSSGQPPPENLSASMAGMGDPLRKHAM